MAEKISGYPVNKAKADIHNKDLLDVSNTPDSGSTYNESQKLEASVLKDWILDDAPKPIQGSVNATGTTYTVSSAEAYKLIYRDNAAANTTTIPNHATDAIPILSQIVIQRKGAGSSEIIFQEVSAGVPQTVTGVKNGNDEYLIELVGGGVILLKTGVNEWSIMGNLTL